MQPHHEILGVAPDAGEADIKRAFRRLAMALHPDRNPEPGAEERFKAVRAAYDAMMAARQYGEADTEFEPTAEPEPPAAAERRGEDIRRDLELTLEEAAFGCHKTITASCNIPCATCDGSGEFGASRSSLCGHCHGSGRVQEGGGLQRCPLCEGRGFISTRDCADCDGLGYHGADRDLQVRIPAGVMPGNELRLAGQGGAAPEGGQPGHLYIRIQLQPHRLFQPVDRDLICQVPVSIFRWIAGGAVDVPLLGGGRKKIKLPAARTLHPEPQRLKGLGLPGRASQPPGDLLVAWQPVLPKALSAEQIALLNAVEKAG